MGGIQSKRQDGAHQCVVERVLNALPQLHLTSTSSYVGCMSVFMLFYSIRLIINQGPGVYAKAEHSAIL